MPSILLATTVPAFVKAFLLPFAEHFRALGWRVDAMASDISKDSECVSRFHAVWDVKWSRNPLDPSNLRHAPTTIKQIVAREGYDIVHVHTPVASLVCRYALRKNKRIVKICTAHGFHFHKEGSRTKNAIFLALEKWAGRHTDYLVVINRSDETAARKNRLVPADRLVYMPGIGVDTERAYNPDLVDSEKVRSFRASLNVGPNDPVVLMLAEFIPRKRHADALTAWKNLGLANAHLVFAGAGPTQHSMLELCRHLGLERQVHFVGIRSDVPVLIRASEIVLLCSDQEGLPRSVMEALSLERPVIGSDIRGTKELLEDGAGYLYPVRDVPALTRVLAEVLKNPSEAAARAVIGRRRMATYNLRHIVQLHHDLYTAALQKSSQPFRAVS